MEVYENINRYVQEQMQQQYQQSYPIAISYLPSGTLLSEVRAAAIIQKQDKPNPTLLLLEDV